MRFHDNRLPGLALALLSSCLAACTGGVGNFTFLRGGDGTVTIGGHVTGLSGQGLVLQNNGADNLAVDTDGDFTFPLGSTPGDLFNVTVLSQPTGADGGPQTCTVAGGTGTATGAVSVTITCAARQGAGDVLGGSVAGLTGTGLVLENSDGTRVTVTGNGPFTLASGMVPGSPYSITVLSQPADQDCAVTNGSGTMGASDVTSIVVSCRARTPTYTVSGTITGLTGTGASITLQDNGRDSLTLTADGTFTFGLAVADGGGYSVSAAAVGSGTQSITCTLSNARGVVRAANITDVGVTCQVNGGSQPPPAYTIGGTVTGLSGSDATLTLLDNGGDAQVVRGDGPFTFATALMNGSAYSVTATLSSGPQNVSCSVGNGSGTVSGGDVTGVVVTCRLNAHTIGVEVSGLPASGASVVLTDNDIDSITVTANGSYTFDTPVAGGGAYRVAARVAAGDLTCAVDNASGTVADADVILTVACQANRYTIGGTVTGLAATGATLTLTDNGGDIRTTQADGPFVFATALAGGSTYNVTAQAAGGGAPVSCSVANGSGTVSGADVTNVAVSCWRGTLVSVAVQGLRSTLPAELGEGATALVLQDWAGEQLTFTADGTQSFPTRAPAGSTYSVTVVTQPGAPTSADPLGHPQTDLVCGVRGGTGQAGGAGVVLTVTCVDHPLGFAYVTNGGGNTLSSYLIAADGTPVQTGDPVPTGTLPGSLSPPGVAGGIVSSLYVANQGSGSMSGFQLDSNSGAPALSSTLTGLNGPTALIGVEAGYNGHLLVADLAPTGVVTHVVSPTVWLLDPSASPPAPVGGAAVTASDPAAAAYANPYDEATQCTNNDQNGPQYAYVANAAAGVITGYSLTPEGLAALGTASFEAGARPGSLATYGRQAYTTDPANGRQSYAFLYDLYAANAGDGTLSEFSVDCASGALTPLTRTPLTVGSGPDAGLRAVATLAADSILLPTPYLYASTTAGVYGFPIDATTGVLGAAVAAPVSVGAAPGPLTTFVSSATAYADTLTSSTVTLSGLPAGLLIRAGMHVADYAGALPPGTTVVSASADQHTVTLSAGPVAAQTGSDGLVFFSLFVYAVDASGGTLTTLAVDPATGRLTALGQPVATGSAPTAIFATPRPRLVDQ